MNYWIIKRYTPGLRILQHQLDRFWTAGSSRVDCFSITICHSISQCCEQADLSPEFNSWRRVAALFLWLNENTECMHYLHDDNKSTWCHEFYASCQCIVTTTAHFSSVWSQINRSVSQWYSHERLMRCKLTWIQRDGLMDRAPRWCRYYRCMYYT